MTTELREVLELVRTCHHTVTFNRHHDSTPPVRAACDRVDKALIEVLRKAIDELATKYPAADQKEIDLIKQSIECGEIPDQFQTAA
jgi:hypothetical protein